jgi:hypothetical protein
MAIGAVFVIVAAALALVSVGIYRRLAAGLGPRVAPPPTHRSGYPGARAQWDPFAPCRILRLRQGANG